MAKHKARFTSGPKKGQFKPKAKAKKRKVGSKKRKRRTSAKKGKRTMARKKRRSTRRTKKLHTGTQKATILLSTAAYGYVKEKTTFGPEAIALLKKLPLADSIGTDALAAILLHYAAKHIRFGRKYTDAASTGLCGSLGLRLGQSGFDMASLQGPGDWGVGQSDDDLVGELDPGDFLDPAS